MSAQDASYLYLETAESPAHVGGLDLVELPAGYQGRFVDEYRALIASRLRLVPLLYSRLEHTPLDLDWPSWVDAEHVDLDYHVRSAALPAPGTMEQLDELLARLHGGLLDRTRRAASSWKTSWLRRARGGRRAAREIGRRRTCSAQASNRR